ncbi:MAG: hypothetical protein M1825_004708 [Sarcosagium campestre]|nr:MAG: hypothetical protein M1825_004708 [Sarcosagium campestre]
MVPKAEKSQLKRGLPSQGDTVPDQKKPRRSQRIRSQSTTTPLKDSGQVPSPLTAGESTLTEDLKGSRATPVTPTTPLDERSNDQGSTSLTSPPTFSSPPGDTQALSQFLYPPQGIEHEIENEEGEGIWGYLIPLDDQFGDTLVLTKRSSCPQAAKPGGCGKGCNSLNQAVEPGKDYKSEEEKYEKNRMTGTASGGYLIGRHPECDRIIDLPSISNRHCLFFPEKLHGETIVVVEDLSTNGTFVNDGTVGRNKRRELKDADEISLVGQARCTFRYPRYRQTGGFRQQYTLLQQLGKGHFATVHLCVEKTTGRRYAVKIFSKRPGAEDRSKTEGLQQEIAVLMSVSHPNLLCLRDTFNEDDGVYLVLELAAEGELFNLIIQRSKLSESDCRKIFVQLFQAIKYLHERNIVHRDIKPENILLVDGDLNVKIADFGLAKIIGEESFTTTLCGTPSYVAPEILENTDHRKYTRAVDIWSLGVVLYICLCGFPPFSDELYSAQNPYTLSQQIKMGKFDYPCPYWDSVGDPALDLIDRMLTVDVAKRYTVDDCLQHPWITQRATGPNDSTDGLTGAMDQLDFSRRKLERERTLLSSMTDVKLKHVISEGPGSQADKPPIKVFEKNPVKHASAANGTTTATNPGKGGEQRQQQKKQKEEEPDARRDVGDFMLLGGKGDQPLFTEDGGSRYDPDVTIKAGKS